MSREALSSNPKISTTTIREKLVQAKNRLSAICSSLQGYDDVRFNEIARNIIEIFEYIQEMKSNNTADLDNCCEYFGEIEQLSSKVSLLLEERFRLHKDIKHLQEFFKTDNTKLFNVITQDMMNDQSNIPGKRKRLEREKVRILENWYNQNSNNPFLNDDTVNQLMNETDLTKVQIRNWFSNKRRKERTSVVSAELSDLLK